MWLVCFAAAVNIVEVTADNYKAELAATSGPVFVKFYNPGCGHCKAMAADYDELSDMFPETNLKFAQVNCIAEKALCDEYKIDGFPTLKLFESGKEDQSFTGVDRTSDKMADWLESQIPGVKAKRPMRYYVEMTSASFDKHVAGPCTFVTFYAPWCGYCKRWLPQAKTLAAAFASQDNVSVAQIDCTEYRSICDQQNVTGFPTIKLFRAGELELYEGGREMNPAREYINTQCQVHRAADGLLDDSVGVIPRLADLVAGFVANPSEQLIADVSKVPGSQIYVVVMKRFLASGLAGIQADLAKCENTLAERKASAKSLDGVKIRSNVFKQLITAALPPPPPPAETVAEATPAPDGEV